ncbi:MAG: hypothetical protein QOF44_2023, partial [Streptomyces sp.]|nr:hypothetical protein [Streptomyces sp.]
KHWRKTPSKGALDPADFAASNWKLTQDGTAGF